MKLYCTVGEVGVGKEPHVIWSGTQRTATANRKYLKTEGCFCIGTAEVEVPTDKNNLLGFLNKHQVLAEE